MKIRKINSLVAIVGLLLSTIFGAGAVFADYEGMDSIMTISPPRQRIILTPGEDYQGAISVASMGTAKNQLKYSVSVGSFNLGKDEDGNVDYNDTDVDTITSYNQIMEWIELGKVEGVVDPGEKDIVPFTIHVPQDAPAGGQYATIIITDETQAEEQGQKNIQIDTVVRFAANIFAEVTGETRKEAEVIENSIPSFLLSGKLEAGSTVKNNGNVHTDASYVLQVWPLFSDEEVCTNEENPSTSMIMPETERYHSEVCKATNKEGKEEELSLAPGIYKARQTVKIFDEESIVEKTVIVCPIWLLFLVIFILVLVIGWIIFRIRSRNGKSSRRDD